MRDKSDGMFSRACAPSSNQTVLTSKVGKDGLSGHGQQQTNKQTHQSLVLVSAERSLFLKFWKWFGADLQTGMWTLLPTFILMRHSRILLSQLLACSRYEKMIHWGR